jgi:hypothetical protein
VPYTVPRGTCPVCGRPIALTLAGRLRVHGSKQPGVWPPENCAGSKQTPEPAGKES